MMGTNLKHKYYWIVIQSQYKLEEGVLHLQSAMSYSKTAQHWVNLLSPKGVCKLIRLPG